MTLPNFTKLLDNETTAKAYFQLYRAGKIRQDEVIAFKPKEYQVIWQVIRLLSIPLTAVHPEQISSNGRIIEDRKYWADNGNSKLNNRVVVWSRTKAPQPYIKSLFNYYGDAFTGHEGTMFYLLGKQIEQEYLRSTKK